MLNRKENLGTEVKNERIRRGMTQSEFASLIGISQSFLSRIESGARRNINLHTWELLSAQVPSLQSILDENKSFTMDAGVLSFLEFLKGEKGKEILKRHGIW